MIGHFLWVLFAWPDGIVVGNLIASAIWGVPSGMMIVSGYVRLHRKIDRHHQWHVEQHNSLKD